MRRLVRPKVEAEKRKDGKRLSADGYPLIGGEYEHRIVYRAAYGSIPRGFVVHHIDCCKTNNAPENLIALPPQFHDMIHGMMRAGHPTMPREEIVTLLAKSEEHYKKVFETLREAKKEYRKLERKIKDLSWYLRTGWLDEYFPST